MAHSSADSFERSLMEICEYIVTLFIDHAAHDMDIRPEDRLIIISSYKCECFGHVINWLNSGMNESVFKDEDGTRTVTLQGWSSRRDSGNLLKDYNEMVLYPVPDRLLYGAGDQQQLLWGEPMNGGVEVLPRLALAFYVIVAAGFALILSIVWIVLRNRAYSWIPRQLFFAPLSYVTAHFLIKGAQTETFFMETDFFSIVLTAIALYSLFSFAWQIWLQHKRTV